MNTINIILMGILIALISLIFGYGIGKAAGREEAKKAIENVAVTFKKMSEAAQKEETK